MLINQKILVVSDIPERIQRICDCLDPQHFAIRTANCGGDAIAQYEDWPAELVISDYKLSGLQDLQLVELTRRMNQRVRFIMIVDSAQEVETQRTTPNRVIAYLRDQFTDEELMLQVQRGLGIADSFYNRRRFSRYKLAIDTHCILINPFNNVESRPIAGLIRDVSRSGLAMLVRQVLPVPAMLKLVVVLPPSHKSITMLAKSLSCTLTQINNVYRLGAKFVGLLPTELEQAISEWNKDHPESQDTDIFMGKSFKKAVEEWLSKHQDDLSGDLRDPETPLPSLVDEVCTPTSELRIQ